MSYLDLLDGVRHLEDRTRRYLHLTANENQLSKTASKFLGLKLSERYFFGAGEDGVVDGNPTLIVGMRELQLLIDKAESATKSMLSASVVNLRCLSGVHAMMCAILSTTEPGDCVMTVKHEDGGHFATQGILARVGRDHVFATYNYQTKGFDIEKIAKDFKDHKCKAIYFDVSYYIDPIDIRSLRVSLGDDAVIIFDASHTMGLIMGKQFQDPFKEGADVICANTHKTLPGPQKGMVVFKDESFGKKANDIINSCLLSSSHTHHMAALSITLLEMSMFGEDYAKQVVENSNVFGREMEKLGYEVRKTRDGSFSKNHQVHVFIHDRGDRVELYKRLLANGISTNFDNPLGGRTFIRVGTQEITRRGMKAAEVKVICEYLHKALIGDEVGSMVDDLNKSFTKVLFSFD